MCLEVPIFGLIIYEKNLSPKVYRYEYIDNKGNMAVDGSSIMKCKGIFKKELKYDWYDDDQPHEAHIDGLRRKL